MNISALRDAVDKGIAQNDWEDVVTWTSNECKFVFEAYTPSDPCSFDDRLFGYIVELLSSSRFLESEGSSDVLSIIEYDWLCMSVQQRLALLTPLVLSYSKLADPASLFLVVEILGRFYCDYQAYLALQELSQESDAERSLIPLGYEQIIRHSSDDNLRKQAYQSLVSMAQDLTDAVREEVDISLNRLKTQGILIPL